VVLHEGQPVVEERTVPRERVRLDKDTVTEKQQVGEEVRKEQIDLDEGGTDVRDDQPPSHRTRHEAGWWPALAGCGAAAPVVATSASGLRRSHECR
jgi:Domain of unknown function (DUF2382)